MLFLYIYIYVYIYIYIYIYIYVYICIHKPAFGGLGVQGSTMIELRNARNDGMLGFWKGLTSVTGHVGIPWRLQQCCVAFTMLGVHFAAVL